MDDSPRILIVDDDHRLSDSIVAVLDTRGHSDIKVLDDAQDAIAHINATDYDLVLLDVMMPGMTGFQLMDELNREEMRASFIIMTGDTSVETAVEALRRGASDYIRKPFDPDELLLRIDNALSQQRLKDRHRSMEADMLTLEHQLQQSQKMEAIGTLAGGIAHDFNNVLAIILGNAELVRTIVGDSHPALASLDNIDLASSRAREMIAQLQTFSRKSDPGHTTLDLNSLVAECLTLVKASIPSNVIIHHEAAGSAYSIQGEATQIHQIVINLCTNAAHAMAPDGGLLEVLLSGVPDTEAISGLEPGAYIRISVADTGSGIDPDNIDRIFDPYFTTKEPGQGTGMGLAVVHGIVTNHRGTIRVVSEPNVRTEFQVFLPLSEERTISTERDGSAKLSSRRPISGNGERILLVDDEDMIVDVLSKMLTKLNYSVEAFTDSGVALAAFMSNPASFDLALSDLTMPGINGAVLAERLCRIRSDLPIILCSGFHEQLNHDALRDVGVREFLPKPATLKTLSACIHRALTEPAAERRHDERFAAAGGNFVIFKSAPSERTRLLDVSLSGLAVACTAASGQLENNDELSIVSSNDGFLLDQVSCQSMSDVTADTDGTSTATPTVTRRRGIRFENLTAIQTQQLGRFIENHTKHAKAG